MLCINLVLCFACEEVNFSKIFVAIVAVGHFHFLLLSDNASAREDDSIYANIVTVIDIDRR